MEEGELNEMVRKTLYRNITCCIISSYFFLMFYSFNSAGNMVHFEHFTLEHYQALFQDDHLMSVIFNTMHCISAAVSTIIEHLEQYQFIICEIRSLN